MSTPDALLDVARLLWPEPYEVVTGNANDAPNDASVVRELLLVPNARDPRIALPAREPRVSAEVVRRYSQGLTFAETFARATAGRLLGLRPVNTAVARLLPDRLRVLAPAGVPVGGRAASLERRLSDILDADVLLGFGIGSARANRKPVLQAVTRDGRTLAYVKVGTSELTRELVRGEAQALATYWSAGPDPDGLRVPGVLHHGRWRELELLVLEAVRPSGQGVLGRRPRDVPHAAMRELRARVGVLPYRLDESPFWQRIRRTTSELHDPEWARSFADAVDAVEHKYGAASCWVGAWHGDWTPWNMAWDGDTVLLWDFERFATGVPVGFDLAHYRLQSVLRSKGETGAEQLLGQPGWAAEPILDDGDNDPDLVAAGYLVELARRWTLAAQVPEGEPLRARTRWLLELLGSSAGVLR